MAVNITWPIDDDLLQQFADEGWTTFKLYVANVPEGPYTDSGVTPDPATIAHALTDGEYVFTFAYSSGTYGQYGKVVAYDGNQTSDLSLSPAFHFGGGMTLAALRQALLRELRSGRFGEAFGGATNTLTTLSPDLIRHPDDYFEGWFLHNTTQDQWRQVADWAVTGGVGTFTVNPSWSGNSPQASDAIELVTRWTPDELRDAINWGIFSSYPRLFREVTDYSLRTQDGVFEYQVPASIRDVSSVEIENLGSPTADRRWTDLPFSTYGNGLSQYIHIEERVTDPRTLRITGSAPLSPVYNETDYTEVVMPQAMIIVYYAAHRLYHLLTNDAASSDRAFYKEQSDHYWNKAETFIPRHSRRRPAKRVWSSVAQRQSPEVVVPPVYPYR